MNFQTAWYSNTTAGQIRKGDNASEMWYSPRSDDPYSDDLKRILGNDYNLRENPDDLKKIV